MSKLKTQNDIQVNNEEIIGLLVSLKHQIIEDTIHFLYPEEPRSNFSVDIAIDFN